MKLEYGVEGREFAELGVGDFVFIPAHMIHRESVPAEGGAGVVVRVGGEGASTFKAYGPALA